MPDINQLPQWQYPGGPHIAPSQGNLSDWTQQDQSNMGRDYGNDSIAAALWGNANAPPDVYFGGTPDAVRMASKYYQNMGNATYGNAAPQIGSGGRNAIQNQMALGNEQYNQSAQYARMSADAQSDAMGNLQKAARGEGPSAAGAQLQAGTDAGIAAQMAMANSSRGQAGVANAQKNAQTTGAGMLQNSANQAAQLRAQEMQQAQNAYMQSANQMQNQYGQQALGALGMGYGAANALQQGDISQAGFQAGQNALNQQGQMGYEQMAFNAQMAQMQAAQGNQQARLDLNKHNADKAKEATDGLMSSIGGMSMLSDARQKDNIRDAGHDLDDALNAIRPYHFEYKPEAGQSPGTKTGVMAQDLATTTAGQSLIGPHPSGGMGVKINEGLGFALGAVGRLNERLNELARGVSTGPSGGNLSGQFGDAQFREPGGDAAYTLREMPDFMLVKNDRTGEMRKMATEPLTDEEKHEAKHAPHGAGPIDGRRVPAKGDAIYGDMNMGGIMQMAGGMMGDKKKEPTASAPPPPPPQAQMQPLPGAPTPAQQLNAAAGVQTMNPGAVDMYGRPLQFGAV